MDAQLPNRMRSAGSVVTRDIPAGVVAVGTPSRIVREIGERDRQFYWRDRRVDITVDDYRAGTA